MSARHDLLNEVAWIPVLYQDGTAADLPLRRVYEEAHLIERIVADEAIVTAALLRFLTTTLAVIAAPVYPDGDFDEMSTTGFPPTLLETGFAKLQPHLWMEHPDTPFMQEPRLVVPPNTRRLATTATLRMSAPTSNGKAWWGKAGDYASAAPGLAEIARNLVASWFYSVGVSGRAVGSYTDDPDVTYRPRGTISFRSHGLRGFWRGRNLAHTLLAGVMESWVRGEQLPLWARQAEVMPSHDALTAATWTGSAYLLIPDEEHTTFTHVVTSGRRIPHLPSDAAERKAQLREMEKHLWRSDPTVLRIPIIKAGEETGDLRPLRALHPSASSILYAADWFLTDNARGSMHPPEAGLVDAVHMDVLAINLEGQPTAPELGYAGWARGASRIVDPRSREFIRSLSTHIVIPIRTTLHIALTKALGKDLARALRDRAFAVFCLLAEQTLSAQAAHARFTPEDAQVFAAHALTAFTEITAPYLSVNTLAPREGIDGIADASAFLAARIRRTVRECAP